MKRSHFYILLAVGLFMAFGLGETIVNSYNPKPKDYVVLRETKPKPITVDELLTGINAERAKAGVKPLVIDPRLNHSAQLMADAMINDNFTGHVNPKTGKHGYSYINDLNIGCYSASENVAWNIYGGVNEAISGWMKSKPHHDAILNPDYETTGFGVNSTVVVEHFCDTTK